MKSRSLIVVNSVLGFALAPNLAWAASGGGFPGILQSLMNSFVGVILPIIASGYTAKNLIGHVQGDPEAMRNTPRVVIAAACIVGFSAVWNWVTSHAR